MLWRRTEIVGRNKHSRKPNRWCTRTWRPANHVNDEWGCQLWREHAGATTDWTYWISSQYIATVMDGIAEAMTEEEDENRPEDQATTTNVNHRILNICSWSVARRLWMTIWADLRWCTTTRRTGRWCRCEGDRGFPPRKCIADSKWRQLFLFHDNRVCHDQTILFQHAANMQHHHAARGQQICTCWHKSQTGVIRCIQKRDGITQFQRGTREGSRQPEEY